MGIGDWGLGIGDWGLGPIPNPHFFLFVHMKLKKNILKLDKFIYLLTKFIPLIITNFILYFLLKSFLFYSLIWNNCCIVNAFSVSFLFNSLNFSILLAFHIEVVAGTMTLSNIYDTAK